MSGKLTVPTYFDDLGEFAEGLVDRVDEEHIILYGPDPFEQDQQVEFEVLLADGNSALSGHGQVIDVRDGGDERTEETRFDVVIGSLEFGGANEAIFERILEARASAYGQAEGTNEASAIEVDEEALEVADEALIVEDEVLAVADEAVQMEPSENEANVVQANQNDADQHFEGQPVNLQEPDVEQLPADATIASASIPDQEEFEALASSEFEAVGGPEVPALDIRNDGGLLRPVYANSWKPVAEDIEAARPAGEYFHHGRSLPIPDQAPRPQSGVIPTAPAPDSIKLSSGEFQPETPTQIQPEESEELIAAESTVIHHNEPESLPSESTIATESPIHEEPNKEGLLDEQALDQKEEAQRTEGAETNTNYQSAEAQNEDHDLEHEDVVTEQDDPSEDEKNQEEVEAIERDENQEEDLPGDHPGFEATRGGTLEFGAIQNEEINIDPPSNDEDDSDEIPLEDN